MLFCIARFTLCQNVKNTHAASWNLCNCYFNNMAWIVAGLHTWHSTYKCLSTTYWLLVGRRIECVRGPSGELRRGLHARSSDEFPVALTTMLRVVLVEYYFIKIFSQSGDPEGAHEDPRRIQGAQVPGVRQTVCHQSEAKRTHEHAYRYTWYSVLYSEN